MSLFVKLLGNFRRKLPLLNTVQCLQKYKREFQINSKLCARSNQEHENKYAYSILENKGYAFNLNPELNHPSISEEQFQELLQKNWSKKEVQDLIEGFDNLGLYCGERNMCISDKMFDNFIDHLTDAIKLASDEQLKSIFYSMRKWPDTESIRTRNYIEVWVALDDECLKRIHQWSNDYLLDYISLFYMIGVIKHSDFCVKGLNRLTTKCKQLTKGQFIHTIFFIGVWRKQPYDMHNLEVYLSNTFTQFSIDDLSIIAMGFFKSKTPIRDFSLVLKIINSMIEHSKNIHEVSLAALLKLVRYSTKITTDDRIYRLFDSLQHEVPRLSMMCNVHMALVGTSTLTLHEKCLTKIASSVIKSLSTARIKDIERLVLTYGTFSLKPQTDECFFTKVMDELRNPERELEIRKYGRSYACCIAYLGLLEIYPVDLINKILSPEFLENTYGKAIYNYGKEILTLHNVSELFCNRAVSNRLSDKAIKILAKKYTDYMPSEDHPKQFNITEKMVLDIMKVLRESRGGEEYVVGEHVLPHHQRGDIIICNHKDGTPVPVDKAYPAMDFGLMRRPLDDNIWTAFVIAGRNALIKDTHRATGHFTSKIRELKALGYHGVLVPWSLYNNLETTPEKSNFLKKLCDQARDPGYKD